MAEEPSTHSAADAPSAEPSGFTTQGTRGAGSREMVVMSHPAATEELHDDDSAKGSKSSGRVSGLVVRRSAPPALPRTSGFSEQRMLEALPPSLAGKVKGLPVAYMELAKSYRRAQSTRTGTKPAKRNIRLHLDVTSALNPQLVSDKRRLQLKNLKPSQYVDAAITMARGVSVEELISAADEFRDRRIGEDSGFGSPNHYSIWKENDEWLDEMMDELLLANTTGLHGQMINVIVESFLKELKAEVPGSN
ncbi:hypothetical protein PUR49_10995 [Streptomyces sp. BE147]|uniref:hypothetical protein n=1 Tax=Streptomyces sp. BE147 TaxID=3002524 RepID=UPI002E793C9A|nr:hypothetical protein [Streptomyces sp. BE147]MEE1737022.1 hypothetical protein [Streptomyces sp. BE147]